jgi:hypothetical protein
MILSLSNNTIRFFSKHYVTETGFCLRLQVKPTQLGPIHRQSPYLRTKLYRLGPTEYALLEDEGKIRCFEYVAQFGYLGTAITIKA